MNQEFSTRVARLPAPYLRELGFQMLRSTVQICEEHHALVTTKHILTTVLNAARGQRPHLPVSQRATRPNWKELYITTRAHANARKPRRPNSQDVERIGLEAASARLAAQVIILYSTDARDVQQHAIGMAALEFGLIRGAGAALETSADLWAILEKLEAHASGEARLAG